MVQTDNQDHVDRTKSDQGVIFQCVDCSKEIIASLDKVNLQITCSVCSATNIVPLPRIGIRLGAAKRHTSLRPARSSESASQPPSDSVNPSGTSTADSKTSPSSQDSKKGERHRGYGWAFLLLAALGLGTGWIVTMSATSSTRHDPRAEAVVLSTLKLIRDKRESARMGIEDITRNLQPRLEVALANQVSSSVTNQLSAIIEQVQTEVQQRWTEIRREQALLEKLWSEHPASYEQAIRKAVTDESQSPEISDIADKLFKHLQRMKASPDAPTSYQEFLDSILPEARKSPDLAIPLN